MFCFSLCPLQVSALHKYKDMLGSGASESSVRLRMVNDGLPPHVVDMFLGATGGLTLDLAAQDGTMLSSSPGSYSYMSPKQTAQSSAVYARLLASGVPHSTVRQKMARVRNTDSNLDINVALLYVDPH